MEKLELYRTILENLSFGIYALDCEGNYIYANRAFQQYLNLSETELLRGNTHTFVKNGTVDFAASDVSIQQKRSVPLFQDLYNTHNNSLTPTRTLIMATPLYDEDGGVRIIVGSSKKLEQVQSELDEASRYTVATMLISEKSNESNNMICESRTMRTVVNQAKLVAETDATILISGASGTGKEVLAHYIHKSSRRGRGRLVAINCASLPDNLLEAELFGYEKGAFTGAAPHGKVGLFELADKGTLFLDEINSIPLNLQGKLLRAIETKTIQRLGSTDDIEVDFRLIVATNEDLSHLVDVHRFRADLFYRLNVVPIQIPPLLERREDIRPLAESFLRHYCLKYQKQKQFSNEMLDYLEQYNWPGNVRELKNFVERSVIMSSSYTIDPPSSQKYPPRKVFAISAEQEPQTQGQTLDGWREFLSRELARGVSLKDITERCERDYMALAQERGRSTYELSAILKTSQTSIMRKKRKYKMG